MKILVLAGGKSSERQVSLNSSKAIAVSLKQSGHTVRVIDTGSGHELPEGSAGSQLLTTETDFSAQETALTRKSETSSLQIASKVNYREFDCVFIGLHGGIGEDGTLQALLDMAGVKYTGSGVSASALAMDKYRSKLIFQTAGIPVPRLLFFGQKEESFNFAKENTNQKALLPAVIKPNREGSTVGLTIALTYEQLIDGLSLAGEYDDYVLVEEYIPGRELTVAVLGKEALPVVEIIPHSGFYDYNSKYTAGETDYICPAEIDRAVEEEVKRHALDAYRFLGCSGYARVDFRMNNRQEVYCLEVNTLPGMTATSLVPKAAKAAGISFEQLLERIVKLAIESPSKKQ